MAGLAQGLAFSTVHTVLDIPVGLQEMVLAVWQSVEGLNQSAEGAIPPSSPRHVGGNRVQGSVNRGRAQRRA